MAATELLVLDSSVALRAGQSTAAREQLRAFHLIGPALLWSEVGSAVHEALWRREIDSAASDQLRRRFTELGVERRSPPGLLDAAWAIADELGWAKTYDAEFLALARIEGCQVLTSDARMRRGAERTGLVMDPTQLR